MSELKDLDPSEGIGLYTDGSCWSSDGSGGWAWLAIDTSNRQSEGSGGASHTTNNRMEMTAWFEGLNALYEVFGPCEVAVFSDSEYVGKGAMDKMRKRTANIDLWELLDEAVQQHDHIEFCHVKGHDGHLFNTRVDKLAGQARKDFRDKNEQKIRV